MNVTWKTMWANLAAEATYYLILAMVPFLVFVVNVLLFLQRRNWIWS